MVRSHVFGEGRDPARVPLGAWSEGRSLQRGRALEAGLPVAVCGAGGIPRARSTALWDHGERRGSERLLRGPAAAALGAGGGRGLGLQFPGFQDAALAPGPAGGVRASGARPGQPEFERHRGPGAVLPGARGRHRAAARLAPVPRGDGGGAAATAVRRGGAAHGARALPDAALLALRPGPVRGPSAALPGRRALPGSAHLPRRGGARGEFAPLPGPAAGLTRPLPARPSGPPSCPPGRHSSPPREKGEDRRFRPAGEGPRSAPGHASRPRARSAPSFQAAALSLLWLQASLRAAHPSSFPPFLPLLPSDCGGLSTLFPPHHSALAGRQVCLQRKP